MAMWKCAWSYACPHGEHLGCMLWWGIKGSHYHMTKNAEKERAIETYINYTMNKKHGSCPITGVRALPVRRVNNINENGRLHHRLRNRN